MGNGANILLWETGVNKTHKNTELSLHLYIRSTKNRQLVFEDELIFFPFYFIYPKHKPREIIFSNFALWE